MTNLSSNELDKTGLEAACWAVSGVSISDPFGYGAKTRHVLSAAISAYLSSTSAGVTEEQTPRVRPLPQMGEEAERYRQARGPLWAAIFDALHDYRMSNMCCDEGFGYPLVDRLSREGDGVSIADGEWEMVNIADEIMAALEASRSPVSQKEAVPVADDLRAEVLRLFKANGMESDERLAILIAEYFALRSPAPSPAGEPGIKALEWMKCGVLNDKAFRQVEENWFSKDGAYCITQSRGQFIAWSAAGLWGPEHGSEIARALKANRVSIANSLEQAQAAAQTHRNTSIRSALHPSPPPVSVPVGVGFDMRAHLQRQRDWSGKTFGPGPRTKGVVDHIRKELCEIEADPSDISEWIDVTILALDGAWRAGHTPDQIIAALVAKQVKNEARNWPDWRTSDPDKAIEHVRISAPSTGAQDSAPQAEA